MFSNDQALINNALPISFDIEESEDNLVPTISLIYKRIANSVNGKESALYSIEERGTFQLYFNINDTMNFRNVFRKCFDMVNLNGNVPIPAGATVTFPHNITGVMWSALIYANMTNTAGRRFSDMGLNIYIDATNVTVTNPDAVNALTQCDVIANYLKN